MGGGQGGCERRSKAFVKIQKKMGGGGRGIRVDVNIFCENSKHFFFFWGGGGGVWLGVRVDVNGEVKFL